MRPCRGNSQPHTRKQIGSTPYFRTSWKQSPTVLQVVTKIWALLTLTWQQRAARALFRTQALRKITRTECQHQAKGKEKIEDP